MTFASVAAALAWYMEPGTVRRGEAAAVLAVVAIGRALARLGPDQDRVLRHVIRGHRLAGDDRRTRRALDALRLRLIEEGLLAPRERGPR